MKRKKKKKSKQKEVQIAGKKKLTNNLSNKKNSKNLERQAVFYHLKLAKVVS
jgi:hypothetical protein